MKIANKPIHSWEIPKILKMLGVTRVCDESLEFKWGWITFRFGLELKLGHSYEDGIPTIHFHPIFFGLHIHLPFFKWRFPDINHSPDFGFEYHNKCLWWHWKLKTYSFHMPWDWDHVRHQVMTAKGWEKPASGEYSPPYSDGRIVEIHDYTYKLKSGEIQERTATIYKEEREWRWRWFKWLPFPKMIRTSISIDFSDEVGEKTGSWKGGCTGCGYNLKPDETMLECLRRMEKERDF